MNKVYKINGFTLDAQTRQFFDKKAPVNLSSRAFDILLYLVQNRGKVIEKDELLQAIWSDSFVEESNLAVHISALRRVLGEKRGESRYIKTVSGRGYTFIASSEEVEAKPVILPSVAAKVLPIGSDLGLAREKTFDDLISLAVLPFTTETDEADYEYLAGGVTQSLIANLSQIPTLKVMAFSAVAAYKASEADLQEIGFLLGVDKLLLGRVSAYKDNLDISIELINAADKSYVWGTQYGCKFTDVFQIRKEISLAIAEKLRLQLTKSDRINLAKEQTRSSDAYKLYLKGKYILDKLSTRSENEESTYQALSFFQEALKLDPNFALAYTGIGRVYTSLYNHNLMKRDKAYVEANRVLQLALSIDDQLSEAYVLKGLNALYFERDAAGAEKALYRAAELDPGNPLVYSWLALVSACLKKPDAAITFQNKALQLDPLSIYLNNGLAKIFYLSGNYNQAIVQAEETLTLDVRSMVAYYFLALTYAQLGIYDEALTNARRAYEINALQEAVLLEGYVLALAGEKQRAVEIAEQAVTKSSSAQIDYVDVAAIYSALGMTEKALDLLEKSATGEGTNILVLAVDPRFKSLRSEPRFIAILNKLNLA